MEPRIQYAKTSDGVNIAYWAMGEGPALIHLTFNFSHVRLEWEMPQLRAWYERLAANRTLVRFDIRGMGLSDRTIFADPLDSIERDIEAVMSRLGIERFALLGLGHTAPPAIAYAAANPERVSRLLLWHGYASAAEWLLSPQIRTLRAMMGADWETQTETIAYTLYGWSEGEEARRFATLIRESITPDSMQQIVQVLDQWDVSELLPQVQVPTLVMHRRETRIPVLSVARDLAARIPDSRFVLLEGSQPAPYLGDTGAVLDAIEEFLGPPGGEKPERAPDTAFRAVLFTDIVEHTRMMQRLGDERGRGVLREHERITREVLKAHGGTEVKTMGDGFMASFSSVTKAVECAIELQKAFDERNREVGAQQPRDEGDTREASSVAAPLRPAPEPLSHAREPLQIRIGLNAGEPIEEEGDLFGATVTLAARIAARAEGAEILASMAVRELCAGKGFSFADRGDFVARGFEEPVRVFEVRWSE
jgi:class 3 adenylate cyclase/pimeloyl-ACP methyl ester carboxylesterase